MTTTPRDMHPPRARRAALADLLVKLFPNELARTISLHYPGVKGQLPQNVAPLDLAAAFVEQLEAQDRLLELLAFLYTYPERENFRPEVMALASRYSGTLRLVTRPASPGLRLSGTVKFLPDHVQDWSAITDLDGFAEVALPAGEVLLAAPDGKVQGFSLKLDEVRTQIIYTRGPANYHLAQIAYNAVDFVGNHSRLFAFSSVGLLAGALTLWQVAAHLSGPPAGMVYVPPINYPRRLPDPGRRGVPGRSTDRHPGIAPAPRDHESGQHPQERVLVAAARGVRRPVRNR